MFERWRVKRELKRLQAQCPHDWHVLRTFKVAVSHKYASEYDWRDYHDMYCPICEKTEYKVTDAARVRYEQKRRIRRLYESGQREFRKGDDIGCKN